MDLDLLTPIERRVIAMRDDGLTYDEIGRRIKRSPRHVERVLAWTHIPRRRRVGPPRRGGLSPVERRVLALREDGLDYEEIARRFRRTPGFIRRVEHYARLRQSWSGTTGD
jgi:DNA-binding CsgD family transcriptional regulator